MGKLPDFFQKKFSITCLILREDWPKDCTDPLFIQKLCSVVEESALSAARGLCLVHRDALVRFTEWAGDRLIEYAQHSGSGTASERGVARESVERSMPTEPWASWLGDLVRPSSGRVLTADEIGRRLPMRTPS